MTSVTEDSRLEKTDYSKHDIKEVLTKITSILKADGRVWSDTANDNYGPMYQKMVQGKQSDTVREYEQIAKDTDTESKEESPRTILPPPRAIKSTRPAKKHSRDKAAKDQRSSSKDKVHPLKGPGIKFRSSSKEMNTKTSNSETLRKGIREVSTSLHHHDAYTREISASQHTRAGMSAKQSAMITQQMSAYGQNQQGSIRPADPGAVASLANFHNLYALTPIAPTLAWGQVSSPMAGRVSSLMAGQVGTPMGAQVSASLGAQVSASMGAQVSVPIGAQFSVPMGAQVSALITRGPSRSHQHAIPVTMSVLEAKPAEHSISIKPAKQSVAPSGGAMIATSSSVPTGFMKRKVRCKRNQKANASPHKHLMPKPSIASLPGTVEEYSQVKKIRPPPAAQTDDAEAANQRKVNTSQHEKKISGINTEA